MTNPFLNVVVYPLLGWMALLSVWLVGYLMVLEIREVRRLRRMEQERQRLGLDYGYH